MNKPATTPAQKIATLNAAQAAFNALAAARTASAVAAGIDPKCDPRPQSAAMKRAAVALGMARAAGSVKREDALAAASAARRRAGEDFDFSCISGNAAAKAAAEARFAAASRAQDAAQAGDFTAYAEYLMQSLPEAEAAEVITAAEARAAAPAALAAPLGYPFPPMNTTPASLLKKITLKRAALAEARAAHAAALNDANPAVRSSVYDAYRLVNRRAYALAGLEDALNRAHFMAAAAHRVSDAALHDADLDATAEDRAAYARTAEALADAAEAVAAARSDAAPDAETLLTEITALGGQSLDFFMSRAGRARACLRDNPALRAQVTLSLAATLEAMRANLAARVSDSASRRLVEALETEADAAAWVVRDAQDAANRAWNAAADAEAVTHAEAAARDRAARKARPGRVASVALAVFAFAVPVTLAAYALTPEPYRALAGALCGCLVGPALGIFFATRPAPPRAVAVEDARTAAHRARCHRAARDASNA